MLDSDSKAQDSGFHKQKIHGFRNPDSLTWGDRIVLDRSYLTPFAIFSIKLNNSFLQQLNSKNNGPVFLFETILGILTFFCLLLQQMARMDKE